MAPLRKQPKENTRCGPVFRVCESPRSGILGACRAVSHTHPLRFQWTVATMTCMGWPYSVSRCARGVSPAVLTCIRDGLQHILHRVQFGGRTSAEADVASGQQEGLRMRGTHGL